MSVRLHRIRCSACSGFGVHDGWNTHRVSVFDSQCAAVYLTEKTDVAFRPFGLDVFDKLVRVCKTIRGQLEREQRSLGSSALGTGLDFAWEKSAC